MEVSTYFHLLPGDLNREITLIKLFNTPYPQILEHLHDIEKIPDFWLKKAALEVDEDYTNEEFIAFFKKKYPKKSHQQLC